MPYRFLPDVALADIAYEADAPSVDGLFESCAQALSDIMVDRRTLRHKIVKEFSIASDDIERLLYDFLTELIVVKDVDSLLFGDFKVRVAPSRAYLTAVARGEPIDRQRHALRNDVKAVTMHMFGVTQVGKRWKATVVLDI